MQFFVLCRNVRAYISLFLSSLVTNESERDETVSVGAGERPAYIRLSAADR